MEENKKKGNGGLIILVVLLLIACIGMGGFIFINKDKLTADNTKTTVDNEKKNTNDSNCKEQKVYAVTDEKITKLLQTLSTNGHSCSESFEYLARSDKFEAKDFGVQEAYHMLEYNYINAHKDSVSLDEYTENIKKILGKDYQFDVSKFNSNSGDCPQYKYNADSKNFTKQETACGWTCGPYSSTYRIVKAVESNDVLEVSVKSVFYTDDGFYKDASKTQLITKTRNDSSYELTDEVFAQGGDYLFTFKNEDGNYVFVSSEPVK